MGADGLAFIDSELARLNDGKSKAERLNRSDIIRFALRHYSTLPEPKRRAAKSLT